MNPQQDSQRPFQKKIKKLPKQCPDKTKYLTSHPTCEGKSQMCQKKCFRYDHVAQNHQIFDKQDFIAGLNALKDRKIQTLSSHIQALTASYQSAKTKLYQEYMESKAKIQALCFDQEEIRLMEYIQNGILSALQCQHIYILRNSQVDRKVVGMKAQSIIEKFKSLFNKSSSELAIKKQKQKFEQMMTFLKNQFKKKIDEQRRAYVIKQMQSQKLCKKLQNELKLLKKKFQVTINIQNPSSSTNVNGKSNFSNLENKNHQNNFEKYLQKNNEKMIDQNHQTMNPSNRTQPITNQLDKNKKTISEKIAEKSKKNQVDRELMEKISQKIKMKDQKLPQQKKNQTSQQTVKNVINQPSYIKAYEQKQKIKNTQNEVKKQQNTHNHKDISKQKVDAQQQTQNGNKSYLTKLLNFTPASEKIQPVQKTNDLASPPTPKFPDNFDQVPEKKVKNQENHQNQNDINKKYGGFDLQDGQLDYGFVHKTNDQQYMPVFNKPGNQFYYKNKKQ